MDGSESFFLDIEFIKKIIPWRLPRNVDFFPPIDGSGELSTSGKELNDEQENVSWSKLVCKIAAITSIVTVSEAKTKNNIDPSDTN